MCFAPQRRAFFRHLNFQKWSGAGVILCIFWHLNFQKWSGVAVFCTFWLGNVLIATTACNFSSFIWPAGSAPAALARLLFHRKKHSEARHSYLFAHLHLLSSDLFLHLLSSHFLTSPPWLFPPLLFHLCILSEVWLLNFLRPVRGEMSSIIHRRTAKCDWILNF